MPGLHKITCGGVLRLMVAIGTVAATLADPRPAAAQSQPDSAAVVAVVAQFHAALSAGDSTAALALLAPDVIILESGGMETREQYRSGHIRGDIAFASAVPSTRTVAQVRIDGNAAWVVSTSIAQGETNGRQVNSAGAELMVLRRTGDGWRIVAIHWSSRARR
jgi:ketosteroid isomerase-like protein